MSKLIFVEGLPGTGKTTISKWVAYLLTNKGVNVELLLEFDERIPNNFSQVAGIPINDFEKICLKYLEGNDSKKDLITVTENFVYLRIDKSPEIITSQIRCWDMGDENNSFISLREYISCALERLQDWVNKNKADTKVIIIDSGFLQNPINELLFRKAKNTEIKDFIQKCAFIMKPLDPICIYLKRSSADNAISFAKKVKGVNWANSVDVLLKEYGTKDFFKRRFALELELVKTIKYIICEINEDNWTIAMQKIEALLNNEFIECSNF